MQADRKSAYVRATTLLPPGITGPAKGEVLLLFRWTSAPHKAAPAASGHKRVAVTWWGQDSPSATASLEDLTDTGMVYTVTCGPKAFSRYLQDMQGLRLNYTVHHDQSVMTTEEVVSVCKLDLSTPVTSRTAVTASDGRLIGTAAVNISMSYTPLVSSFEMNEHLASIDHSMPLFPRMHRIVTPLRQLNLQPRSNAQSIASSIDHITSPLFEHHPLQHRSPHSTEGRNADNVEQLLPLGFSQLHQTMDRCPQLLLHSSLLSVCRHPV